MSNSAPYYHIYADDTQLHLSYSAEDFSQSIIHIEYTITIVANWISVNVLPPKPLKLSLSSSVYHNNPIK